MDGQGRSEGAFTSKKLSHERLKLNVCIDALAFLAFAISESLGFTLKIMALVQSLNVYGGDSGEASRQSIPPRIAGILDNPISRFTRSLRQI